MAAADMPVAGVGFVELPDPLSRPKQKRRRAGVFVEYCWNRVQATFRPARVR